MKINSVFYQSIFYSLFRICKVEKWEFKNIRKKEKKNCKVRYHNGLVKKKYVKRIVPKRKGYVNRIAMTKFS